MRRYFGLAATLALTSGNLSAASAPVEYAARIAPLFEEHCVDCHAAGDADGELNLESFEALLKGGKNGKAIQPGNAQESLLVKFLEGRSGKEGKNKFMPPGKKEHLKTEEIALIRQWIDSGAPAPAMPAKLGDVFANLPKIAPKTARPKGIQALAYSEKAGVLAVGLYGSVQLLDATTRVPRRALDKVAGKVNALAFSADGTRLFAAAGDAGVGGVAYEWTVADGALLRKYDGHKDALYALALSPDGQTLATGSYDQKIKLWNIADGKEQRTLSGHNGGVFGLSFRPDGKVLASASADRTVKLWAVATGARLDTFSQPLKEQTTVAFAPDGKRLVAAGVDNRLRVWEVSEGAEEGSNPLRLTRFAHEGAILNLAFYQGGQALASTAADRTVKLWTAADLTEQRLLEPQPDWAPGLAVLKDGQLALGRLDGSLGFYLAATGAPAPTPAAPSAPAALPEITRVEPRGLQRGATTKLAVTGKNLAGLQGAKFTHPGVSATVASVDPKGMSAELTVTADAKVPRTSVELSVTTAGGESMKKKLLVDDLPQLIPAASTDPAKLTLPVNVWGTLARTGQRDEYRFTAKKGETLVFDLAAQRVESKALTPRLEILDDEHRLLASNNGLDTGSDPFLAFTAPRNGEYLVRILEITLEGSPDHVYRLTAGALPYVTGWWPLSVPANAESDLHLVGYNLPLETVRVSAGEDGEPALPPVSEAYRSRVNIRALASTLPEVLEQEGNDAPDRAQPLSVPASVNGRLFNAKAEDAADFDFYRIEAEKGQQLVIETRAAMLGSPADTKIEVLNTKGEPVPRVLLQATKDSWLTLRSADSKNTGIRLGQFDEMELNDYMYFNGEVLKIYRLARGPDADMTFFPRAGARRAYFDTTSAGHGHDEPCYVVEPKPVGSKIVATGLPVFTLNYTNDDDSERLLGKDSRLTFTAPEKGSYLIRVSDTRGWSGPRFAYRLIVRQPVPDFSASLVAKPATPLPAGSGQQMLVRVERMDGFEGDVRIDISNVPPGFYAASPTVVQAGQLTAPLCVYALPGVRMGVADFSQVKVTATATVAGHETTKTLPNLPALTIAAPPKEVVYMEPEGGPGHPRTEPPSVPPQPLEMTIAPGGRASAWLRVVRNGNNGLLSLNVEGLPFGVIVDSIGLNGVQIREGETEREIFLRCAAQVPEQDRLCHAVTGNAGGVESVEGIPASYPVLLKVRRNAVGVAAK